ncbi:unnamed protein product, partial [Symbiodinium natans]
MLRLLAGLAVGPLAASQACQQATLDALAASSAGWEDGPGGQQLLQLTSREIYHPRFRQMQDGITTSGETTSTTTPTQTTTAAPTSTSRIGTTTEEPEPSNSGREVAKEAEEDKEHMKEEVEEIVDSLDNSTNFSNISVAGGAVRIPRPTTKKTTATTTVTTKTSTTISPFALN